MVKKVGPFELGKCVGKGATASVYLAHEPIRRKDVAIKQLKHSENSRRTIAHEVETMTKLAHENVAQIYTKLEEHGCTYLVMEIIGGGELFDTVKHWKREGRERQTFHYFNQLMTGLKFLHNLGYAHRDLKLENLLLSTDGVLKIADFGVSKSLQLNPMRTCCGSPDYIAPEIITQKDGYDGKLADLWSCGVIFFAMMSGEFPFENAALILKGLYKSPKHFPVLAKESLIKRIFVVDPAKRIQSVEEIQATQWMQQFNAQRNTFGMYRDVLLQIRDLRSKKAPIKIGGVLQCRFQFLRIMLMVKVVKALKEPSIKGAPRDVKAVIQDRLYSALHMLQNCVKALPANQSTDGSTHEVNWVELRASPQYCTHFNLLSEVQRAHIGDLAEDDRLALFLNMYHLMLIHGCANAGCSLKDMRKDVQAVFFDNTTIVVGYIQFSLNDIYLGILRANQPKPGGGLFGNSAHFSDTLYPDKIALSCPSLDPIVHCCLSNLTTQSPRIVVYEGSRVHEQMLEIATAFIREQVSCTKAGLTLPNVFKDFPKDFGKTEAEKIAFVKQMMDDNTQKILASVLNKKGECGIKYAPKTMSFVWKHQSEVKQWDQRRAKRFEWTETKQTAWREKQAAMAPTRAMSPSLGEIARDTSGSSFSRTMPQGSRSQSPTLPPLKELAISPEGRTVLTAVMLANDSGWSGEKETPHSKSSSGKKSKKAPELVGAGTESQRKELKAKKKKEGKEPRIKGKTKLTDVEDLVDTEEAGSEMIIKGKTKVNDVDDLIDVIEPLELQPEDARLEIVEVTEPLKLPPEDAEPGSAKEKIKKTAKTAQKTGEGEKEEETKKMVKTKGEKAKASKPKKVKKQKANDEEDEQGDGSIPSSHRSRGGIDEKRSTPSLAPSMPTIRNDSVEHSDNQNSEVLGTVEESASEDEPKKVTRRASVGFPSEPRITADHFVRRASANSDDYLMQRRPSSTASGDHLDMQVTEQQFQEAMEVLTNPIQGRLVVSMREGAALVIVKDEDGYDEAKYLPLQDRLQLMQQRQLLSRNYLMSQTAKPKSLAELKRQPDIKTRYSEKKNKQNSSVSEFCVVS